MIKDKNEFDRLLIEYVNLALEFYDDSNFDEEILNNKIYDNELRICREKVILSLLFANATIEDFNNPIDFLKRRIDFIYNDLCGSYNFGYMDMFKGDLSLDIDKDIINNETPYQMIIRVKSMNEEEFVFPKIKFGISDDTVYIYAIQNKMNEDNSFCKKINRVLYKVGEGYNDTDEIEEDENLKDITASFLVSLNIAISYLYNNGYNNYDEMLLDNCFQLSISNIKEWVLENKSKFFELLNNKFYNQNSKVNDGAKKVLTHKC